MAGFAFESMVTMSESAGSADGEPDFRMVSRYRMRRGDELFACAQDVQSRGDVDGRVKLQPGSMSVADVLRRVVEWEGARGGRFSFVFVSGGGDSDFEVYVHYPKL